MTAKEKLLWQLRVLGLPPPVPEYKFHDHRKWRIDWYFPDAQLGVEFDGIFSAKSGHRTMGGRVNDYCKDLNAALAGIWIVRCCHKDVTSGLAATAIETVYRERTRK